MEVKQPVKRGREAQPKPAQPPSQTVSKQMGLAEMRRLCKEIADDIDILAQCLQDPDMEAQVARLRQQIKTNLDRITDYWQANHPS